MRRIQKEFKRDSKGIKKDFAMDLCTSTLNKTLNPKPTQEQDTHLQSSLYECNDLLARSLRFDLATTCFIHCRKIFKKLVFLDARKPRLLHGAGPYKQFWTQGVTTIKRVRSDNGSEFKNTRIDELCDEFVIRHQFSTKYTPQSNDLVERKNRTLIDMARSMLSEYNVSQSFWAEAINKACIVATTSIVTHWKRRHHMSSWMVESPTLHILGIWLQMLHLEERH